MFAGRRPFGERARDLIWPSRATIRGGMPVVVGDGP